MFGLFRKLTKVVPHQTTSILSTLNVNAIYNISQSTVKILSFMVGHDIANQKLENSDILCIELHVWEIFVLNWSW